MPSRWIMRGAALALSLAVPEALIAKDAPGALWFGTENFTPADIIDARAKPVQVAQSTLAVLATTDVSFDLPGLAETLTALRNLKFARERGATAAVL